MSRTALSLLFLSGLFATQAKATIAIYSFGTSGAVASDAVNVSVLGFGAPPPFSETSGLSAVDYIRVAGNLVFTTPSSGPTTLTAGYTATRTLYELGGVSASLDLTSFLDAYVTSNLTSSSALVTSVALTTSLYETTSTTGGVANVLIGSVNAGGNNLAIPVGAIYISGPDSAGPFAIAFGQTYFLEQDFSETISGIAAGETLTLNLPGTSGIGTPSVPEPAPLLLTVSGLAAVFVRTRRRAHRTC